MQPESTEFLPPRDISEFTYNYKVEPPVQSDIPGQIQNSNFTEEPIPYIKSRFNIASNTDNFPVCKRRDEDGNFVLTFGGVIKCPKILINDKTRNEYVNSLIENTIYGQTLPFRTTDNKIVRVSGGRFLQYGHLTITTENYLQYPQKINACHVCCRPPVYFKERAFSVRWNILFFLFFIPSLAFLVSCHYMAVAYNAYMAMMRYAAGNIKANKGEYVPVVSDETVERYFQSTYPSSGTDLQPPVYTQTISNMQQFNDSKIEEDYINKLKK